MHDSAQQIKSISLALSHTTPFVGRERELADIRQRLSDPTCRLLTLVGPGGMGKTRLAQQAALSLDDMFPDGVYFVPLQPLTSPELIIPALAEAVDFQFAGGEEPQAQLLNLLHNTTSLLILDNFEHLLDGAGLVTELLTRAPFIKVLVTSRERLNLRDEWLLDVGGLSFPTSENDVPIETQGAVQLFVQHARQVQSSFSLENEKAAVVRICALLQGMPLAIELASAWVRALSCADILKELERGLDILETPARDVHKRHQGMRAVLDTSWKRLSEAEQAVFRGVSIFRGGFTLAAVQAIAGASPRTLSVLIDQSWLRRDQGSGRYEVHELLRQYGEEKLAEAGRSDEAREAHCDYYVELVREREKQMEGRGQLEALKEIEADFENIRSAWNWGIHHGKESSLSAIVYSLWFFLDSTSRYHEGEQLIGEAEALLQSNAPESRDQRFLGRLLTVHSIFRYALETFDQVIADLEQALAIFQLLDARSDMAFCLLRMGDIRSYMGRKLEAQPCFQRSLDLYRDLGDQSGIMEALFGLAAVAHHIHDVQKARELSLESQTLAEQIGNRWGIANAVNLQAGIMRDLGDYQSAWDLTRTSNALYQELGVRWGIAITFNRMSYLAIQMGHYAEARHYLLRSFTIATGTQLTLYILYCLDTFSDLLEAQGALERAVELLGLIESQSTSMPRDQGWISEKYNALQGKLSPFQFDAAFKRGAKLDLNTTAKAVMAELSQPFEAPQSFPALPDTLTLREIEVLRLVATGLSNQQIAEQLFLTRGTVKWYLSEIYSKLGVSNRTQAVACARELKLLS